MKKIKKKRETKEEIEERVRREEQEKYSYEKKRSSNTITMGVIGAIVGMLYFNFKYPQTTILGLIYGAITGGLIGAAIGNYFG